VVREELEAMLIWLMEDGGMLMEDGGGEARGGRSIDRGGGGCVGSIDRSIDRPTNGNARTLVWVAPAWKEQPHNTVQVVR